MAVVEVQRIKGERNTYQVGGDGFFEMLAPDVGRDSSLDRFLVVTCCWLLQVSLNRRDQMSAAGAAGGSV